MSISNSSSSNSRPDSHEADDRLEQAKTPKGSALDQHCATVAPITKGETYGIYDWAVDVTVPAKWNKKWDRDYAEELLGIYTRDELFQKLCSELEDYHGVLTFAFCYLKGQDFDRYAEDEIFPHLPVAIKVEMLKKLFRQRGQDAGYLERFDSDLRRFLDVEQICMPVL